MSNPELRILNPKYNPGVLPPFARRVRVVVEWADGKTSTLEAQGNIRFKSDVQVPEDSEEMYFGNATDLRRIPSGFGRLGMSMYLAAIDKVTEAFPLPTVAEDSLMVKEPKLGTLPDMVCSLCGTHLKAEDAAWTISPTGNSPACGGGCPD
jgi:hypothetical protein